MLRIRRPDTWLIALLASTLLLSVGASLFMTFIGVKMKQLHYPDWSVGLIHSAFYLGLLLGIRIGEMQIIAVGHIRTFSAFAALFGTTIVAMEQVPHPLVWGVLRAASGVALGTLYLAMESWFLLVSQVSTRGRLLTLYSLVVYLSQATGQLILLPLDFASSSPFNLSAFFCLLAIIPIAGVRMEGPELHMEKPLSWRLVLKRAKLGMVGCFSAGMLISSLYSFIPVWALARALPPEIAMVAMIIGGTLFLRPIGRLAESADKRRVALVLSFILLLLGLVPALLMNGEERGLYPILAAIGGMSFSLYPIALILAQERFPDSARLRLSALCLMVYGMGSVVGPLFTSIWVEFHSGTGLFASIGMIALSPLLASLYSLVSSKPVPEEKREEVPTMPRTTQLILQVEEESEGD